MGKQVTWLGDADPAQQVIEQGGHRFVKGEAVTVDGDVSKFENNPAFTVGKKGEPVASEEPEQPDPEAGTEIEAIKRQLDARSVKYADNAKLDTLRGALAKAEADAAKDK